MGCIALEHLEQCKRTSDWPSLFRCLLPWQILQIAPVTSRSIFLVALEIGSLEVDTIFGLDCSGLSSTSMETLYYCLFLVYILLTSNYNILRISFRIIDLQILGSQFQCPLEMFNLKLRN